MTSQDFTLEVHYKNICPWLLERKKLPADWNKKLKAAQLQFEELQGALQRSEVKEFNPIQQFIEKNKEFLSYIHANEAFEKLQGTEEGRSKNMLGQYKNQLVKDWNILMKIYQKDNIYLAEIGKQLSQLYGFDLPALKKQITSVNKHVQDTTQRQNELIKASKESHENFKKECQKQGVKGVNLKSEILSLVEGLADIFEGIDKELKDEKVLQFVEYYREFGTFIQGIKNKKKLLEDLEYFARNGDELLVLREHKHKNNQPTQKLLEKQANRYQMLRKFKIQDLHEESLVASNIDWNKIDTNQIITVEDQPKEDPNDKPIDMEWEIIESGYGKDSAFEVISTNEETILSDSKSRNHLLDDINEAEFFINQRLLELNAKDQGFAIYEDENMPAILKIDAVGLFQHVQKKLEKVVSILNDSKTQQLISLRQNPQSSDRIEDKIMRMKVLGEKQEKQAEALGKKQKEFESEREDLNKNVKEIEEYCKRLKLFLEEKMKDSFKKKVNVLM